MTKSLRINNEKWNLLQTGFISGGLYLLQTNNSHQTMEVYIGNTFPSETDIGFVLVDEAQSLEFVANNTNENIYVRALENDGATVTISYLYTPTVSGGGGGGGTPTSWGTITGILSSQTDLQNALDQKADDSSISIVGKSNDYNDLDNKPTIPTKVSDLTNDSNFVTQNVTTLNNFYNKTEVDNSLALKQDVLTAGTNISIVGNVINSTYTYDDTSIVADIVAINTSLGNKLEQSDINNLVQNVSYDGTTGVLSIVKEDGTSTTHNLPLETFVQSGMYNSVAKTIELTMTDGTVISIPAGDLVDEYIGDETTIHLDTTTNTFSVATALMNIINGKADTTSLSTVATTGDYDDLLNKPVIPTKTSDLTNDSGFITNAVNDLANYTLTTTINTQLAEKVDVAQGVANTGKVLVVGSTGDVELGNIVTEWGDITGTLSAQTDLQTALNSKVDKVVGHSLLADTEIARLLTLSNYDDTAIQQHMSNNDIHVTLADKTTWNDKYTKAEIDTKINAIKQFSYEIVATLPTSDMKENVIYLVQEADGSHSEYIYINDSGTYKWEFLGKIASSVDLSGYYTSVQVDALLNNKQNTLTAGTNISIVGGTINSTYVYDDTSIVSQIATKQDTLVSGTNIKTINGVSLLGNGDISVTTDLTPYYTATQVDTLLNGKQNTLVAGTNISITGNTINSTYTYDDTTVTNNITSLQNDKVDKVVGKSLLADTEIARLLTLSNYDDTTIVAQIGAKQDALVSGVNIKTIQGETILGSGNIVIDYNGLVNKPTNLSSFTNDTNFITKSVTDLDNFYNKTEIDAKLVSSIRYKGSVANYTALTSVASPNVGDLYNVLDTGDNYIWSGTEWDKQSGNIDLSNFYTKPEVDSLVKASSGTTSLLNGLLTAVHKIDNKSLEISFYGNPDDTTKVVLPDNSLLLDISTILGTNEIQTDFKATCGLNIIEDSGIISFNNIALKVDKTNKVLNVINETTITKDANINICIPLV